MSSASKASWVVAASVAAVEALKDQAGFCRWNYALRSIHQHAKRKMSSFSAAADGANNKRMITPSSSVLGRKIKGENKSEESLRTVMYLSCWGPN
ncbi:wound induced protein [Iris pallida]|uniref:Wound induced protein n=1 Tax=Iris pallida TaxID=29817 RepID=A0AAX6GFS2_IRIPA|nr:wound induced protein [Iris pallida]